MHGFSDRTGLDLADDDPEFAVGIRGDLVIPLVFNLERRILEHRYQLLIEGFDDLILFFNRRIRIADHHHGEVLIVLLYDAVRDDILYVVYDTGDIAPLRDGSVFVVDDIVHAALQASGEAQAAAHVAVQLIVGGIIDQRQLCLVQRGDDSHALEGRAGQILIVNVYDEQVAVDLVVFLPGYTDHAGSCLGHSIGIDQAGAEYFREEFSGSIIDHLPEGGVEGRLPQIDVVLLDILGDAHQEVFVVIQVIRLIDIDLIDQRLCIDPLLDGVGHILPAQDPHLLDGGVMLADRSVQGVGPAHGLSGKGIKAPVAHRPEPVGDHPAVLHGGDQDAQRTSGRSRGRRHVPVFIFFRILFGFLVHPVAELVLGQERKFIQVFGTMIVVRCRTCLLKTGAVKRNFISCLHQLVDTPVLGPEDPVAVLCADRFSFDLCIGFQGIQLFKPAVQIIVSHSGLLPSLTFTYFYFKSPSRDQALPG